MKVLRPNPGIYAMMLHPTCTNYVKCGRFHSAAEALVTAYSKEIFQMKVSCREA